MADAQEEMGEQAEQRIGAEIGRFNSHDAIYIGVLLASGILIVVNAQVKDTVLGGIILALYQLLLLLTAVSYVYLRVVRKKRYSQEENGAISLSGNWLIHAGAGVVAVFIVEMFIITILEDFFVYVYLPDALLTVAVGVLAGSALFLKRNYRGEGADTFVVTMADGLAWVLTLGSIGALVLADSAYMAVTILRMAGVPFL